MAACRTAQTTAVSTIPHEIKSSHALTANGRAAIRRGHANGTAATIPALPTTGLVFQLWEIDNDSWKTSLIQALDQPPYGEHDEATDE